MSKLNLLISFAIGAITIFGCSPEKEIPITPETALQRYLDNGDNLFKWETVDTYQVNGGPTVAFDLLLTTQQWREHIWKHQFTVLKPEEIKHDGALLFITGGSIKNGEPNFKGHEDELTENLAVIAEKNNALIFILRQTPNQPLYDNLVEDQLISFTLHNFKNDGDYTWPLLFPMVKSAVKAMDAAQEFSDAELQHEINRFIVSGASKRGWTTWLTGANDPRVTAIAPMVIDVLNMPISLDYQLEVWKEYSIQIEDYTKLEIPQQVRTEAGDKITKMVDPYSYRRNLTMPKMIFIGTIDEYWPVDAVKNYLDSIPGENFIQYVPNAGHDLGDKVQALQALSSFLAITLRNQDYPACEWAVDEHNAEIYLDVKANPELLVDAVLWCADSKDRDFRDEKWEAQSLQAAKKENVKTVISYPENGYKAFYMDLKYLDPNGEEYVESTRMFVADSIRIL
ncbi:MAG: PhoPQ-activated pathogenicity-related family protein [Cytophagales bacterium]|nr:PhoPQ-activated pathogenicity-related family protein [Cytophagales bacterium]